MKAFSLLSALLLLVCVCVNNAAAVDCNLLRAIVGNTQVVNEKYGNIRKDLFAKIFPPREMKNFDLNQFELAKAYYRKNLAREGFRPFDDNLKEISFEAKFAYLEVIAESNGARKLSLNEMVSQLPPYRKTRFYRSVRTMFEGKKPVTLAALEYRLENLYADVLRVQYPHLFDWTSETAVENSLKTVVETRLSSRKIAETFSEIGLIEKDPTRFRAFYEQNLKGIVKHIAPNTIMNATSLKTAIDSKTIPYFISPPPVPLSRWVNIPEDMLERAARTDLETVWNSELKDYLVKKNRGLIKTDIIYRHVQSTWTEITYWALMGYLVKNAVFDYPEFKSKMKKQAHLDESFNEVAAVEPDEVRLKLNEAEQQERWGFWKKAHPAAAADSTSSEYKGMHRLIFGD